MWKEYFTILSRAVNFGLILLAFWFGIVNAEYAHGSFLLLLALVNNNLIKV